MACSQNGTEALRMVRGGVRAHTHDMGFHIVGRSTLFALVPRCSREDQVFEVRPGGGWYFYHPVCYIIAGVFV